MNCSVTRAQVLRRLRDAGWEFNRMGKRHEIWKKKGNPQRTNVPTNKLFSEDKVRMVFGRVGLTAAEIDEFLASAVK